MFIEKSLWTSDNVGYLVRDFAENLDYGEGGFFEKLETNWRVARQREATGGRDVLGDVPVLHSGVDAAGDQAPPDSPGLGVVR